MARTRRGVHISAIFAVALLFLAIFLRPSMEQFRQRKAISEFERVTTRRIEWEWAPSTPAWLFNHFNDTRKHWGDWIVGASVWQFAFDPHEAESLKAIPYLRNLTIRPSFPKSAAVEGFPQLERLNVHGFIARGSSLVIRNCPKLSQIAVNGFNSVNLEISDLSKLQELKLSNGSLNCRVTLFGVPNLRILSVIGSSGFIDQGVFTLRDLPGLETIKLDYATIKAVDFSGLQTLRKLYINYSLLDDVGITSLCGLRELQSLQLYHCALSDTGLAKLDNLPELEFLELRGTNVTVKGLTGLGRFPRLRALSMDWSLTQTELEELQRALPRVIIECPFRLKNRVPPAVAIALQEYE